MFGPYIIFNIMYRSTAIRIIPAIKRIPKTIVVPEGVVVVTSILEASSACLATSKSYFKVIFVFFFFNYTKSLERS